MKAITLTIDHWIANKSSDELVSNLTLERFKNYLDLLGNNGRTLIVLRGNNSTSMTIGGGKKYYIVFFTDEKDNNSTLVNAKGEKNKTIELVAGGQLGKYPMYQCSSKKSVLLAAKHYFLKLKKDPVLSWE